VRMIGSGRKEGQRRSRWSTGQLVLGFGGSRRCASPITHTSELTSSCREIRSFKAIVTMHASHLLASDGRITASSTSRGSPDPRGLPTSSCSKPLERARFAWWVVVVAEAAVGVKPPCGRGAGILRWIELDEKGWHAMWRPFKSGLTSLWKGWPVGGCSSQWQTHARDSATVTKACLSGDHRCVCAQGRAGSPTPMSTSTARNDTSSSTKRSLRRSLTTRDSVPRQSRLPRYSLELGTWNLESTTSYRRACAWPPGPSLKLCPIRPMPGGDESSLLLRLMAKGGAFSQARGDARTPTS